MYEIYKVFDCQPMATKEKTALKYIIHHSDSDNIYNGMYFYWSHLSDIDFRMRTKEYIIKYKIVKDYLYRNGAEPKDKILIIYWW